MKSLGFLGGGTMAEAILSGIVQNAIVPAASIVVAEINTERGMYLQSKYGVFVVSGVEEMLEKSDTVLLAVKPYQVEGIVRGTQEHWKNKAILSIMAGWSMEKLKGLFPGNAGILRAMPNTAAQVGQGMTALVAEHTLEEGGFQFAQRLFSACGETAILPEKQFDIVTAISGSGPAYCYMFIDAMAQAGVLHGLPKQIAVKLAAQTMLGAATMVKEANKSPNDLKDAVCTPGGTTIEAVYALEKHGITAAVMDAVTACYEKSKNM